MARDTLARLLPGLLLLLLLQPYLHGAPIRSAARSSLGGGPEAPAGGTTLVMVRSRGSVDFCPLILGAPRATSGGASLMEQDEFGQEPVPLLKAGCKDSLLGTHSLSYDFTINPKPAPGQLWCEVHSQVDQKPFYSYDCGTEEMITMSDLGKQVHATQDWKEQKEVLKDVRDILKQHLDDIRAERYMTTDPLILQGRMSCWRDPSGHIRGSLDFRINGQKALHLDIDSGKWEAYHPEFIAIKEMWENDRDMTAFLQRTTMGDCKTWLGKLLLHSGERLEPTDHTEKDGEGKVSSTTTLEIAAPASMATRPSSQAVMPGPWALLVLLSFSILILI